MKESQRGGFKVENKRKSLMVMFILVLVVLPGCGNSNNETQKGDDHLSTKDSTNIVNDTIENASEDIENTDNNRDIILENNNATKTKVASNNVLVKEENPSTNEKSLKDDYLKKLNNTKKEAGEMEATDASTYAMKKVENDRWVIWDELLNEIYGVLKEQLSPEEMDQLREEQRKWVDYRDDSALEASIKYKGGTQEHLEYVAVLANLTEKRCYELVGNYMK